MQPKLGNLGRAVSRSKYLGFKAREGRLRFGLRDSFQPRVARLLKLKIRADLDINNCSELSNSYETSGSECPSFLVIN